MRIKSSDPSDNKTTVIRLRVTEAESALLRKTALSFSSVGQAKQ